jgi:DNA primase
MDSEDKSHQQYYLTPTIMTRSEKPRSQGKWLSAEELKSVPVRRVLESYGLLEEMTERGPTLNGPSPFSEGDLSVNLEKNVWNDSHGRPELEGRVVPGNVIGLVMAVERVGFRRALEILDERHKEALSDEMKQVRAEMGAALRKEGTEAKREGNEPFGKELQGLRPDVPFLGEAGIPPALAKDWGVGWCSRGLLRGRIAFPIRSADGTVMAYVGLSPKPEDAEGRWRFPSGFQRSLELFGIDRVHQDEKVRQQALEQGLTLAEDPLEVLQLVQSGTLAVVSPMGAELGEPQIAMLLDPKVNPSGRLTLAGSEECRAAWARVLIQRAWVRYVEPGELD